MIPLLSLHSQILIFFAHRPKKNHYYCCRHPRERRKRKIVFSYRGTVQSLSFVGSTSKLAAFTPCSTCGVLARTSVEPLPSPPVRQNQATTTPVISVHPPTHRSIQAQAASLPKQRCIMDHYLFLSKSCAG